MTPQASTAFAERSRTVPPEARHQHDSACYWDVDDCRWRCATYPPHQLCARALHVDHASGR
jgi:hypothetical protein